jgi:hypothetical protein
MIANSKAVRDYFRSETDRLKYSTVQDFYRTMETRGYLLHDGPNLIVPGFHEPLNDRETLAKCETSGECMKLSLIVAERAEKQVPDVNVAVAEGIEPRFFNTPASRHKYLLVTDAPLVADDRIASVKREYLLSADPLLVDPSFGVIGPFGKSLYHATHLYSKDYTDYGDDLIIVNDSHKTGKQSMFPLGINKKGEIVYLTTVVDPRVPLKPIPAVTIYKSGYQREKMPHFLDDLRSVKSEEIEEMLKKLKKIPIVDRDEFLKGVVIF